MFRRVSDACFILVRACNCSDSSFMYWPAPRQKASSIRPNLTDTSRICISDLKWSVEYAVRHFSIKCSRTVVCNMYNIQEQIHLYYKNIIVHTWDARKGNAQWFCSQEPFWGGVSLKNSLNTAQTWALAQAEASTATSYPHCAHALYKEKITLHLGNNINKVLSNHIYSYTIHSCSKTINGGGLISSATTITFNYCIMHEKQCFGG